jgi:hypothetical protein
MIKRSMYGLLFLIISASVALAAEPSQDEAIRAAKSWLALVDAGKYEESWDQSGALFRRAVTKQQWNQALGSARTPLGAVKSRELKTKSESSSLPGAPDGRYLVMQFQTSFASKASAVETVTTVLESDGRWRVVGYYIK